MEEFERQPSIDLVSFISSTPWHARWSDSAHNRRQNAIAEHQMPAYWNCRKCG